MKTITTLLLAAGMTAGFALAAADSPTNVPSQPGLAAPTPANPEAPATQPPAPPPAVAAPDSPSTFAPPAQASGTNGSDGLRLNFRNVPLEMVLNYLSDAAGFIIVLDTPVRGTVDVWSNQPLTKDEAVSLLNAVLNKNGYAAIRNDRTLTIVSRDSAKTRDIPVKRGNEPNEIPKNEEIVTQIVPVRFINAAQVTKDLQPLMPMTATMTANEAGNALVITDTQANIRRMAEIVKALDTALSSSATIRVYPLKYADAKTVATVIKDLFQAQDSGSRSGNDLRAQFFQRMRGMGGGGPGGFPGGDGGGGGGGGGSGGRAPTPKVLATSDDRSNALVVSAPDDIVPTIDKLVEEIDVDVEDVTEVRVFRLKFADPVEMADLLAGLFPDESRSNDQNSNRRGFSFGGGGMFGGGRSQFGGGRGQTSASGQQSDRTKKMGRVLAVPDQRTSSVVVSAAKDMMVQIAAMIEQLDADPRRKQKVFVYSLENADVQEVEQILRNMFDKTGTMNSRNSQNQNSRLNTRSTQNQNTSGSGLGSGGTGGSRSLGGSGLGGN
ncbi:MAG: hypothetical protein HZA90_26110 [Verrucomicrobia bacterium]|nr:hypothetical protein [Verrucomicrobiota bacterium]